MNDDRYGGSAGTAGRGYKVDPAAHAYETTADDYGRRPTCRCGQERGQHLRPPLLPLAFLLPARLVAWAEDLIAEAIGDDEDTDDASFPGVLQNPEAAA